MRSSVLWLAWLVLPVFVVTFHYGPGQIWLARDYAATFIKEAESESVVATDAQEAAYKLQLELLDARRAAFVEGIDWQTQTKHPLAQSVIQAETAQDAAYDHAAEVWHRTAKKYSKATETLLKSMVELTGDESELSEVDRNLMESLLWAEARALVRSGEVFNGINQLQALLDLRTAEANQQASFQSAGSMETAPEGSRMLPTHAIREELAAAQYVGARLLREEGRPGDVWRPVSRAARQHYRYLSESEHGGQVKTTTSSTATSATATPATATSTTATSGTGEPVTSAQQSGGDLDRHQRMQRNLEQVLNLEQLTADQLEGVPLPRTAPQARRPGDGQPGNQPGSGPPNRGPLQEGPPGDGAGVPQPWGGGW